MQDIKTTATLVHSGTYKTECDCGVISVKNMKFYDNGDCYFDLHSKGWSKVSPPYKTQCARCKAEIVNQDFTRDIATLCDKYQKTYSSKIKQVTTNSITTHITAFGLGILAKSMYDKIKSK